MNVLVTGGLGFVGSHIVEAFALRGDTVVVIDGCLPETGGAEGGWDGARCNRIIRACVEDTPDLCKYISDCDLVVDAMGWTRHMAAINNPMYDLKLNVQSHLHLMSAIPEGVNKKVIYLGSRGQYGNPQVECIDEDTPQIPVDVQGINKVAAESHWRQVSRRYGHQVVSLRFGNCYGVRQPTKGNDIGLLGGFIRSIFRGETIDLYGRGRTRPFINVRDVANAVVMCADRVFDGFVPLNLASDDYSLEYILEWMIEKIGRGSFQVMDFPKTIKALDVGNAGFSGARFFDLFPDFKTTTIEEGLSETLIYIERYYDDMEM